MKRLALLVLVFAAVACWADIPMKNAGTNVGYATSLNCLPDAGLTCGRTTSSVGTLKCNAATSSEPGCIAPGTQTLPTGDKTFVSPVKFAGVAHASLEACDGAHLGNKQTCSTHSADVFCNGTTNIEYTGAAAVEVVLGSIYVNGIPVSLMGSAFTPPSTTTTITALEGSWGAGTTSDGGTLIIKLTSGGNTCSCTQPCASSTIRTPCTGTCTGLGTVSLVTSTTTCTMDPYVGGDLIIKGTAQ